MDESKKKQCKEAVELEKRIKELELVEKQRNCDHLDIEFCFCEFPSTQHYGKCSSCGKVLARGKGECDKLEIKTKEEELKNLESLINNKKKDLREFKKKIKETQ
jgi:hypothetical protein